MIPLVIAEATKLKIHATQEEISNLNINKLDANYSGTCIYGQITGNCWNDRAVELIELSCEKANRDNYWSPIELFIYRNQYILEKKIKNSSKKIENQKLIAFLKGETEILKLK